MPHTTVTTLSALAIVGLVSACQPLTQDDLEPITSDQYESLEGPEPGAGLEEYGLRDERFMLYGVERAGTSEPFAVIANRRSAETRTYLPGDLLARNWRVVSMDHRGIELRNQHLSRYLLLGERFEIATITHTLDRAVDKAGHHAWTLRPALLAEELARYGRGAELRVLSHPDADSDVRAIEVIAVEPRGLFAHLRLSPGDVIAYINGLPLTGDRVVDDLVESLTSDTPGAISLGISRHGNLFEETYRTL